MGREQKRNFATVADVVEEAARIHDEAILRTNECITTANQATEVSQRVDKQVQAFERILDAARVELTRRLDAQGQMVMTLEQRQRVISESVTCLEEHVAEFHPQITEAYRHLWSQYRVLAEALLAFREMSFSQRLSWVLFGRAAMVPAESAGRAGELPHETPLAQKET
jgi:hypothetical protein